jgi:hypothetical protein
VAAVRRAPLAVLPIQASVMIIARGVSGAKANPVAGRLAPEVGLRPFVALAVPIITFATRITGREGFGPAPRAAGVGSARAIVGPGFIQAFRSKAGLLHKW